METELKILLLEDSLSDAEILAHTLRSAGLKHRLKHVDCPERYMSEMESFFPDIILADHALNGLNSLDALRLARARYPDIPFILVSGAVSEELVVKCLQAGADDFIPKNQLVRLYSSIKNIMSKVAAHREKEHIQQLHEELKVAYKEIEDNNKNITDSLNYARLIQDAMLPDKAVLNRHFPHSLIIYRPKDIVSGDFYWFVERDGLVLVAVADCTGHGVPGSLMSMIGYGLLNEIVNVKKVLQPAMILDHLNSGLRKALKQDSSQRCDGMDIAVVCIDKGSKLLEFAGANRHLIFFRQRKLELIKGNKYGIGGLYSESTGMFTNHTLQFAAGDVIYLCTDGYADQFGGSKGKRMMTRNLFKILEKSLYFGVTEQEQVLIHWLEKWQGDYEQTDDILLLGIQLA